MRHQLPRRHGDPSGREGGAGDHFAPEKAGLGMGVLGGVIMVVIAVVWFVTGMAAGMAAGRIFFYPPILALIGLYGIVNGLTTGNLAGRRRRAAQPGGRGRTGRGDR